VSFLGKVRRFLLVVEIDYLPDSEVFYFQPCLYPMKYLHPRSMHYKVAYLTIEIMLGCFSLEGNPSFMREMYCGYG
jgi:hypothetical protein